MTLIVALACTNGIVMGADSASTDPLSQTKLLVSKIQRLRKYPVLFGGAGDFGLIQKLTEDLNDLKLSPSAQFRATRREIRKACLPALQEASNTHIRVYVPGCDTDPPTATLLFGGIHRNKPFLLEIEANGRDTLYDDNFGNFRAIGRGTSLAQAVMWTHLNTKRDLQLGKILAYRVLEDSIALSSTGLAKPIHLYAITLDGSLNKLDDEELVNLKVTCETWRDLERETLGSLLAPSNSGNSEILPLPNQHP